MTRSPARKTAEHFQLFARATADLDSPAFGRPAIRGNDKDPIAAGALKEGAHWENCRRRIPAELQLTLSGRARDEHGRARSLEIQIDPEESVVNLRIHSLAR